MFGQCADWSSFLQDTLNLPYGFPNDDVAISAMKLVFYADHSFRPTTGTARQRTSISTNFTTTCTDPAVTADLARTLTALDAALTYEGNCDGNTWRVFSCFGSRVFCINCKKKCVPSVVCPGTALVFNPCATCPTHAAAYAALSFQHRRIPKYPAVLRPLNLTVNSTWISVRAALTGKGHLYCAALPIEVGLQSVAQIQYFGAASVVLAPQSASVNLTGLYPDTAYRVHCYTDAFSPQHAMPFLEALATGRPSALDDADDGGDDDDDAVLLDPAGQTARTGGRREIALLVAHPIVFQFVPNSNIAEQPFFFALSAPPPPPAALEVVVSVGGIPCAGQPVLRAPRSSGPRGAYAAPSAVEFSSSDPAAQSPRSLERSFFIRSASTGCFNVTISGTLSAVHRVMQWVRTALFLSIFTLQVRATLLRQPRCMFATSASPQSALT